MPVSKNDAGRSEEEIAKRRDDALRRALETPPKPHKGKIDKGKDNPKGGSGAGPKRS